MMQGGILGQGLLAYGLEGLAGSLAPLMVSHPETNALAVKLELPLLAARLWGTAQTLREEISAPLTPSDMPLYEQQVKAARARVNALAFSQAWTEGQASSYEEALAAGMALDRSALIAAPSASASSFSPRKMPTARSDTIKSKDAFPAPCRMRRLRNRWPSMMGNLLSWRLSFQELKLAPKNLLAIKNG